MSTFQRSKILIVQQSVGQTAYVCKKYPAADTRETMRKAMELVRSEVANPALFMRMAIKWRIAPKTEVVEKNQKHPRFTFSFPVVIKSLDGREMVIAQNAREAEKVTRSLKSVGYQVQEYLRGYTFMKVQVVNGFVNEGYPSQVYGAVRRLVTILCLQGLRDFTLTVATNKVTTYVIGAKLS